MAIFNVLELNQRFMDQMGIYFQNSGNTKSLDEYRKSAVANFILFNLVNGSLICAVKIYNSNDFREKTYALMILIAMSQAFGVFLSIRLKRKNVTDLHHKIQSIVDDGQQKL